eukprot:SRR837773.14185.p1 GENE.SRR837773.14185~~SRR837773.14185.p1  ORF type:complete len:877 (-),score=140.78 SRR837773.14185:197-2509(-)
MSFTAASMSLVPLSPIHESENEARCSVSSHGARKSYGDHRDSLTQPRAEECSAAARLGAVATPEPRAVPELAAVAEDGPALEVKCDMEDKAAPAAEGAVRTPESGGSNSPLEHGTAAPAVLAAEKLDPAASVTPARPAKVVHVNGVPYTVLEVVGRGGSSKVFGVLSPSGERLALKRVDTDSMKQLEAFENEVGLLQHLRHCEQVVHVVDAEVNRERGRITIVMEAGEADLNKYLHSCKELSLEQIQRLWRQMIEAVQVVHAERIVHSDLKPANFLMVNGRVKIIDFGIAKKISCDTTNIQRENSVGTLSYMAPEAVKQGKEGVKLGRASDIWALGIILYQMVYGRPPMANMEAYEKMVFLCNPSLEIQCPPGHILEGHCSETRAHLMDIIGKCLQRDPRRRPSLAELLEHPFLQSRAEVSREAVHGAVSKLMGRVLRLVGFPESAIGPWQALSGEIWEDLLRHPSSSSSSSAPGRAAASAEGWRPFEDAPKEVYPEGLAFLEEMAHHFAGPFSAGAGGSEGARLAAATADAEAAARSRAQALLEDSDEDGEPTLAGLGMAPPGNTGPLQRLEAVPPGSTGPLQAALAPPGSTGPLPAAPPAPVEVQRPAGAQRAPEQPPQPSQPPAKARQQEVARRAPLAEIPKRVHRAEGYREGGGAWKAPPAPVGARGAPTHAADEKQADKENDMSLASSKSAAVMRKVGNAADASALAAPPAPQAPKKLAAAAFTAFGGRGAAAGAGQGAQAARATPASLLEQPAAARPRPGARGR